MTSATAGGGPPARGPGGRQAGRSSKRTPTTAEPSWPPRPAATLRTLIVAKSASARLEVLLGSSCLVIGDRGRIRTHEYRLPSRAGGDATCDQNLSVVEKSTSIRSEFSGPGLMK